MVTPARSLMALEHPAVAVDRAAEIALQHLPEPFAVLDDEGIVQVIALAERRRASPGRTAACRAAPCTGSPGARWTSAKTPKEMMRRSGTATASRQRMKRTRSEPLTAPIRGSGRTRRPCAAQASSRWLALLEAVALARIDDQLGRRRPARAERRIEFLRLAERRAAVLVAVQDQRRRRRLVEAHERRAVERDVAVALLA